MLLFVTDDKQTDIDKSVAVLSDENRKRFDVMNKILKRLNEESNNLTPEQRKIIFTTESPKDPKVIVAQRHPWKFLALKIRSTNQLLKVLRSKR